MRKVILSLIIILSLVLVGCAVQKVTCNKPYIKVGTECCLDQNDNAICDSDEAEESFKEEITKVEPVATGEVQPAEEEASTYTLSDLQADIGNVFWKAENEFLVLEKNKEVQGVIFYAFQPKKAVRLGKRLEDIFKVIPYKYVIVSISEEKLEPGDSFLNFIKKHSGYLTEPLQRNKEEFIKEFSEGTEFKKIKETKSVGNYIEHISEESVIIDNFKLLETVSGKIATRDFVSLENYNVSYSSHETDGKKEVKLTGINYLQSVSIFCTPTITITIYHKDAPISTKLDKINLGNYYKNEKSEMIADAQAIINMCEERYEFSYLRTR